LLDPLERVAIEPLRAAQPLGEQPQPLGALLISQQRLLGGREGARGGTLYWLSVSAPGRVVAPS
jgi:hypothetical protein